MRLPSLSARIAASLAALLVAALPLAAQDDGPVDIAGRVVDAASGAPLAGAWLRLENPRRAAVSGTDGRFVLERVPRGEQEVSVGRIGYESREVVWSVAGEGRDVEVALSPGSIALEAITVQVDRLERRARSSARAVRGFGAEVLAASPLMDAEEFVRLHAGLFRTACPLRASASTPYECVLVRGRSVAPCVVVDERPATGGFAELARYRPQDLQRVDVLGNGAVIQIYTSSYVQSASRRGWRFLPPDVLTMTSCARAT